MALKRELTISELEARMRPGAWSGEGFLGATESLEALLARDAQTLSELGITPERIAAALENVLLEAMRQEESLPWEDRRARMIDNRVLHEAIFRSSLEPYFTLDNLPQADKGYCVGHFQVFTVQYRGFQECPWGCADNPKWGSFDFVIVNRETGEYLTGPGLIVHLIDKHHFFEGLESSYRVEPLNVVHILELRSD